MMIAAATQKMIAFYKGSTHDIGHFLKVWALAQTIGTLQGLDSHTQEILELAAVVHFRECVFRTAAGTALLDSMYLRGAENP